MASAIDIQITHGTGSGPTEIAALDAALFDAGIANFNLLRLSSIIPPGANLIAKKIDLNNQFIGQKLYVVISYYTAKMPGEKACAGLGWKYSKKFGGIFVEHSSNNYDKAQDYIEKTLDSMNKYRGIPGQNKITIIEAAFHDQPTCALIAALYSVEDW